MGHCSGFFKCYLAEYRMDIIRCLEAEGMPEFGLRAVPVNNENLIAVSCLIGRFKDIKRQLGSRCRKNLKARCRILSSEVPN